jgi:hypothetical protein
VVVVVVVVVARAQELVRALALELALELELVRTLEEEVGVVGEMVLAPVEVVLASATCAW